MKKQEKTKKECLICGSIFYVVLSLVNKRKTCSHKCMGKYLRYKYAGEKSYLWKGGEIKYTCKLCGREGYCKKSAVKNGHSKFCSTKCYGKWQSINKQGDNNHHWMGGKIKLICQECNKEYEVKKKDVKHSKYCSRICQNNAFGKMNRGENHHNWKGGISREPYGFNFGNELKELIRKRDNYKCVLCQAPQEELFEKLSIHHIDYNKQNCNPNNLISLCKKCHMKTNYKRDEWIPLLQEKVRI